MTVSIIIPCYRQAQYLSAAIDSCLRQTHQPIEVIVVNDGSPDNVDEVVAGYRGAITYISQKNAGVSAARNTGIAAASGEYMKFLDADDHIAPEQIERQLLAINGRNDTVSVTTLRAYYENNPDSFYDIVPEFRAMLPDLLNQPDGSPHAWLFPSSIIREVKGWVEEYIITQDWDLLVRIGKLRPKVCCDQRVGGFYRLREGSLSAQKRKIALEVAKQLIALHDEFRDGPDREWFGSELLGAEQRTYRRMLLGGFRDRELEQALLTRIKELRGLTKPSLSGRKFEGLCQMVGYSLAERLYVQYLKRLKAS